MCDTGTRRFISGVVEGEQPGTRGASSRRGPSWQPAVCSRTVSAVFTCYWRSSNQEPVLKDFMAGRGPWSRGRSCLSGMWGLICCFSLMLANLSCYYFHSSLQWFHAPTLVNFCGA